MLSGMRQFVRSLAVCGALVAGVACATPQPPAVAPADPTPVSRAVGGGTHGHWWRVLHELDLLRARAFADGDAGPLKRVYVPGSSALRSDEQMLRDYLRRGLRFDAVRIRLASVAPVRTSRRTVVLRVVDRLAPVRVREPAGDWTALPRDVPTERTITLRRVGDAWRIAGIRRIAG